MQFIQSDWEQTNWIKVEALFLKPLLHKGYKILLEYNLPLFIFVWVILQMSALQITTIHKKLGNAFFSLPLLLCTRCESKAKELRKNFLPPNSIPTCSIRILWVIQWLLHKAGRHCPSFGSVFLSWKTHFTTVKSPHQILKRYKRVMCFKHTTLFFF